MVSALFKVSVGHLFYDLEYGKSLEFWIQKSVQTLTVSAPPLMALVPQEKSSRDRIINPLLNYFIDQACSVKVTGDWPCTFLCVCFFNGPRFRLDPRTHKTIRSMFSHLDLTLGQ